MLSEPLPIVEALSAAKQIDTQASWWRKHRSQARYSFEDKLQEVYEQLRLWPWRGAQASAPDLAEVRRVPIPGVDHWLLYRVVLDRRGEPIRVEVLAVWHYRKADQPQLDG